MIAHYFKIIWNRKKQNFLLMLELFIAFLVLCVVAIQSMHLLVNYQMPLGFDYKNVWVLEIDPKQDEEFKWTPDNINKLEALSLAIKQLQGTQEVAGLDLIPYTWSNHTSGDSLGPNERISIEMSSTTDEGLKAMGLEITKGRWFSSEDNMAPYAPVVINERYAEKAFGNEDPIGKSVMPRYPDQSDPRRNELLAQGKIKPMRVVGVMKDYRKNGELSSPIYFAMGRKTKTDTLSRPARNFVIKVDPGYMNGAYEEQLIKTVESIVPEWTFRTSSIDRERDARFRSTLTPLMSFGLVALFLLIMVALGLVGVIWQNVTARTGEIGLRRALGAHAGLIFQQIIGELMILTAFSLVAGTLVLVQFPLLDFEMLSDISAQAFVTGWLIACVVIIVTVVLCGLYPSKLATSVQPTEALHEE
jgi:putative ABC transport system permease protein